MNKQVLTSVVIKNVSAEIDTDFTVNCNDRFKCDLGLDSLDCADIALRLSDDIYKATDIQLDYEVITNFIIDADRSVQNLIDYLAKELNITE